MADQNPLHCMPLSRECIALRFDSSKPREICKFWEDIETHFEQSGITDNECKPWVLQYVDSDTHDFWESFEEASSDEKTYEEFKAKINEYYPRADGTRQHMTAELLAYIDQALSDGICQTRIDIGAPRIRCEAIGLILESEVTVIVDQYQCVKTDVSISEV